MSARGDRRGVARGGSRRDRHRGRPAATRDADASEDEWTEEDGDVSRDVEAGGALARDGSRDASSSGGPSRDVKRTRASRQSSWSVPIRTASDSRHATGELEPILRKTSKYGHGKDLSRSSRDRADWSSSSRGAFNMSSTDDEHDASTLDVLLESETPHARRHKTRARVVLGATLVLGLACATGVTATSAFSRRAEIEKSVATFPERFSSEKAGGAALSFETDAVSVPRLSGVGTRGRAAASEEAPGALFAADPFAEAFQRGSDRASGKSASAPASAARAGLFLSPPLLASKARGVGGEGSAPRASAPKRAKAAALSRLRDAPLLGRFFSADDARAKNDESTDTLEEDVIHTTRHGDLTSPGFDDLFFPALGDARLEKDDAPRTDPSANEASPRTTTASPLAASERRPSSRPKYLIGLTTSAGFGDQFKRVSTYAAMARELNRTLVVWPVFTSPHYDLDGSGPDARGPLFFDEYVRIGGDGVTDSPNRLVSYRDPSLPRRVRDFPLSHPNSCVTSNGERVDVQFPVSADLSRAVVAKAGTASSYEEQVRALRRMGDSPDGHEIETLCVASTFGNADYNKARHGETALAWKSLDFRPVGRFHHWWANAVDNMVLAFGPKREAGMGIDDGRVPSAGRSTKRLAPRALDRALDGAATAAGAGAGAGAAARAAAIEKRSSDASSSANPGRIGDAAADDRDGSSSSVFSRTEPSFRVTSKYTALHWRRGDKCGKKSKRQASRNAGPVGHSFDARGSGASQALLCDEASYLHAPVLDLCVPLAPMYVATDDQDEAFLAHVKRKGCLLRSDLVVSPPAVSNAEKKKNDDARSGDASVATTRVREKTLDALEDVDALVLDVMLVAGAEVSFTYGHTALARLYDRMRMSRGAPRSINVAADAEAFRRASAAAFAGAGASAAAAAALGEREGDLVAR